MPGSPESNPRPNAPPSPRQRDILLYITNRQENGRGIPTLREIGEEFGIHHVTAYEHVLGLVTKGWVAPADGKARQFKPVFDLDEEEAASATMFFADP